MADFTHPRVVSLLPGATEMVVVIGGREQLVGISHECDWPADITRLPRVTSTPIDPSAPSAAIHLAVQDAVAAGRAVIGIDASVLQELQPDVVLTQVLCDVCAVADGEAMRLAQVMAKPPRVVALEGRTLAGVWRDIELVGEAIGRAAAGRAVAAALTEMVRAERARASGAVRPRVVAVEWLEPLFLAGHWVPEMIEAAGGEDVGATAGSHSVIHEWRDVIALDPDVVLIILCGFSERRARKELEQLEGTVAGDWLAERRVEVLDGNAFTSRPGPRLVDGIRQMAAAFRR